MNKTILLINASESVRRLISDLYQQHLADWDLQEPSDPALTLDAIEQTRPAIILVEMPFEAMEDPDLCKRMKEASAQAESRVIAILPEDQAENPDQSPAAQCADTLICHPLEPSALFVEIQVLLRLREYDERHTRKLKESEAQFRTMFEYSPDAILVQAADGTILDTNLAATQLYGKPKSELVGANIRSFLMTEGKASDALDFSRLSEGGLSRFEGMFTHPEGRTVYIDILARMISYEHKPAILLEVRDITKSKKIERALRETAETVSESAGFSFFYGLVQQVTETLGVDFVCVGATSRTQPDAIDMVAVCHKGEVQDNNTFALEDTPSQHVYGKELRYYPNNVQEMFPKDGTLKELQAEAYMGIPLFGSENNPLGLLALIHHKPFEDEDLARALLQIYAQRASAELERMQASEELWMSEEKYRSLTNDVLEASAVGLFILDRNFLVVWANQAVETYFGFTRDDLIGSDYRDLVRTRLKYVFNDPESFGETVLKSFNDNEHLEHKECRVVSQEGRKERWLEHWSQPIRHGLYAKGRIEHFADITIQKRLQAQLLQSQKMESIGRLAGGIAHDFNNLLTSILGFSYLIKDDLEEAHPAHSSLDEVIQAGQRAENLTRQLLVFSRKQASHLQSVDVNSVVEDMNKLLRRTLGDNIQLKLDLHQALGHVFADPSQLEQVIMNLCINARDAMPKGGTIIIHTSKVTLDSHFCKDHLDAEPGEYILLSTRDTGIGMSKEIREHACEPFFTTKEKGKGTGLGLAIVYGILQQFKGFLHIESEPGEGAEINIYLPTSKQTVAPVTPKVKENIPTGNETILVVEDEESVRHLTVKILTNLGYQVLAASDGADGLVIYNEDGQDVDLVLTDVIMPNMNGPEMIHHLLEQREDLKYIFTSGFTEDALSQHGLDEKKHILIAKPYTRRTLAQSVRQMLDAV